jgi:putative aminopeptidase FrvX
MRRDTAASPPTVVAVLVAAAALAGAPPLRAQGDPSVAPLAERFAGMTAESGYEQAVMDTLVSLIRGAARDRAGNVVLRVGSGERKRLVACGVDEPGVVVGGIRDDGYLTLRRVGRGGPLVDQQLEGQRITVFGRRGAVPGVVGVRSIHLTRGRPPLSDEPFALDDAYVDVGARSRAEVAALGVGVLAPVALTKRPHRYGDELLAAPVAGARSACAALLAAARRATAKRNPSDSYTTVVAFTVESRFGGRGLAAVAATLGRFDETVLLGAAAGEAGTLLEAADTAASRQPGLGAVTRLSLPVRYAGWPVETVSLGDVDALARRLAAWIGGAE